MTNDYRMSNPAEPPHNTTGWISAQAGTGEWSASAARRWAARRLMSPVQPVVVQVQGQATDRSAAFTAGVQSSERGTVHLGPILAAGLGFAAVRGAQAIARRRSK